jgi:endonuclease/exonuclease/phosphatase family metal-dependent hydrolase
VRIASFNLLHGRSTTDGAVDADRLHAAIKELDVDVLALQEVDRNQPRSHGLDLTAIAADAMGARDHHFAAAITGTPGEGWRAARDDDTGTERGYGVALLSRAPVRGWRVVRLPGLPVRRPRFASGRLALLRDEPRVALAAIVEAAGRELTVTCTHLSFVPGWNTVQLRRLLRALDALPSPQLLAGDLNIPGALPRPLESWTPLARVPTFPAHSPRVQLDHVLARDWTPRVRSADAVALPLSDHRALVVDIDERGN